jgi:hypothetical protein
MGTWQEKLSANASWLGIVLTALGIGLAIGYPLGKDTNDGLVNYLRERFQAAEKTELLLRGEITALKLELQSKSAYAEGATLNAISALVPGGAGSGKGAGTGGEAGGGAASGAAEASGSATGALTTKSALDMNREESILRVGQSTEFFADKLSISLVGMAFEGNPQRYKSIMVIGSVGKANLNLDKVDVGYAVEYENFEVRVLATDSLTSRVRVTKLSKL